MKIMISGGGTGGHIYPALTLINTLKIKYDNVEFLYIGTKKGLESDIVPRENIPYQYITVEGFKRKITLYNFKVLYNAIKSFFKARKIINDFKPDVVVGTGGYVCGPVLLAAATKKIPTIIQEQNAMPGVTNKILGKFVNNICLGYEKAKNYFQKEKVIVTGNPIRDDFLIKKSSADYKSLDLDENKKTILISGGSRGAKSINDASISMLKKYLNREDLQIILITGSNDFNHYMKKLAEDNIDLKKYPHIKILDYAYNMPKFLRVADLCVLRAGASTLSEITAMGKASILIPYPYAAANHQEVNARELEKNKAAKVILNKDLNEEILYNTINEILTDEAQLKNMERESLKLGKPSASYIISEEIVKLTKK